MNAPSSPDPVSITTRAAGVLRTVRPHQWVKNVFVLAPVVFAKEIADPLLLWRASAAFMAFCLLAGAVYTMNDLADVEADRRHPVKRFRPIASGRVPIPIAKGLMLALVVTNFGNVMAEFAGVASSLELFGVSKYIVVPMAALVVWALVVHGTYASVEKIFLSASLFYIAYIV